MVLYFSFSSSLIFRDFLGVESLFPFICTQRRICYSSARIGHIETEGSVMPTKKQVIPGKLKDKKRAAEFQAETNIIDQGLLTGGSSQE